MINTHSMFLRVFSAILIFSIEVQAVERVDFCRVSGLQANKKSAQEFVRGKQFLFFNGIGRCNSNKFADARAYLKSLDSNVPSKVVCAPAYVSVEKNLNYVWGQILAARAYHPDRPLVVVGHSKGALELLNLIATKPFVDVDQAILINAPLGGSVIVDIETDNGSKIRRQWEEYKTRNFVLAGWIARVIKNIFVDTGSEGFRSLSSVASQDRRAEWSRVVTDEARSVLQKKVIFVSSSRLGSDQDVPFYLKSVARFMAEQSEPSDGLVFEKDQFISEFGRHLYSVQRASHFALTGTSGSQQCHEDFWQAVYSELNSQK